MACDAKILAILLEEVVFVQNGKLFIHLQVRLCQMRLAAQISLIFLTLARYKESAALKIIHVHKDEGNLIIIFAKGKNFQ